MKLSGTHKILVFNFIHVENFLTIKRNFTCDVLSLRKGFSVEIFFIKLLIWPNDRLNPIEVEENFCINCY